MLFEFFMNFLNIEKKNILRLFFFKKMSCFLRVLCYFQHLKKNGVNKIFEGGGFVFSVDFLCAFYAIFNINKNLKY